MYKNERQRLAIILLLLASSLFFGCGDDDDNDNGASGDDDNDDNDNDNDDASPTGDDDNDNDDASPTDDDDDDETVDPSVLTGKVYQMDIPLTAWSEPDGVGDIIGFYVPVLLFGVQTAGDGAIQFLATIGEEDGATIIQDECVVTTVFTDGALSEDGSFSVGPQDYQIRVQSLDAKLYGATCSGKFSSDGADFSDAVLAGVLDVRELIDLFWIGDEDDVCEYASLFSVECAPCPTDNESYCVGIKAEGFSAAEASGLTLQEIGPDDIGPECDDDDDDDNDNDNDNNSPAV